MNYIVAIVLGVVLILLYQKYRKDKVLSDNDQVNKILDELTKQLDANNTLIKNEEEKQTELNKEIEDAKKNTVTDDVVSDFLNKR